MSGFTRNPDQDGSNEPKVEAKVETQSTKAPQPSYQPTFTQQTAEPKMSDGNNNIISQLLNMATPTVIGNSATGSLVELQKHIKETLEKNTQVKGLEFHLVTDSTYLAAPAIIFYRKAGDVAYFFSVIPAALIYDGRLENLEEYVHGVKTVIDMPPSKIYDADFIRVVSNELRQIVGANFKPTPISYYVIPRDASLDDERTAKIAIDTANKALTEAIRPTPAPAAEALRDKSIEVKLSHEINPERTVQFVDGEPIAADFVVRMKAQAKKTNASKTSPNAGGQSITLSRLAAKIDFFKIDPRMGGRMMAPQMAGMYNMPMPAYHPMLVVTEVEGLVENSPVVIENQNTGCAAVASLAQMGAGRNWVTLMETGKNHPRRMSLFGLDHEPWPSQPLQPREIVVEKALAASKPENRTMNEMVDLFFHPNSLTVAWDIRDGGRSSWAHQAWLAAAEGNVDANDYLISIFDTLTGGHFSKLWAQANNGNAKAMLVSPMVTIIHNGYFIENKSGKKHDIREIDYLYMLNACKEQSSDPVHGAASLVNTYAPGVTNGNEGIRIMDTRRKMISDLEPSAVFTGISRRLYLAPNLLSVCGQAMHAAGLVFNPEGLYDADTNQSMAWQGFVPGQIVDPRMMAQIMQPQFGNGQNGFTYAHNPYMHNGWNR